MELENRSNPVGQKPPGAACEIYPECVGLQLKTGVMCENLEGWIFFRRVGKYSLKALYIWEDLLEGVGVNLENQSQISAFGKMLDFNLKVALGTYMQTPFL